MGAAAAWRKLAPRFPEFAFDCPPAAAASKSQPERARTGGPVVPDDRTRAVARKRRFSAISLHAMPDLPVGTAHHDLHFVIRQRRCNAFASSHGAASKPCTLIIRQNHSIAFGWIGFTIGVRPQFVRKP